MARERRVVTPDGYVWHLRRHRARRRPPWSRRGRPVERFHGDDDQHPTFDWHIENDDTRPFHALVVGAAAVAVVGLLAWLATRFVIPWLVPFVVANAGPLAGGAAA